MLFTPSFTFFFLLFNFLCFAFGQKVSAYWIEIFVGSSDASMTASVILNKRCAVTSQASRSWRVTFLPSYNKAMEEISLATH